MTKDEYNRIVRALWAIQNVRHRHEARSIARSCLRSMGYYDRDEARWWIDVPEGAWAVRGAERLQEALRGEQEGEEAGEVAGTSQVREEAGEGV